VQELQPRSIAAHARTHAERRTHAHAHAQKQEHFHGRRHNGNGSARDLCVPARHTALVVHVEAARDDRAVVQERQRVPLATAHLEWFG
jgi:hypothetical protein